MTAAAFLDQNLINPWGMAFSVTNPVWVSIQALDISALGGRELHSYREAAFPRFDAVFRTDWGRP
jgi:hypothetical protein